MSKRHLVFLIFVAAFACRAQDTVAPTPGVAGPRRGDDWGDYNVVIVRNRLPVSEPPGQSEQISE